jgi:hypothetical protein
MHSLSNLICLCAPLISGIEHPSLTSISAPKVKLVKKYLPYYRQHHTYRNCSCSTIVYILYLDLELAFAAAAD